MDGASTPTKGSSSRNSSPSARAQLASPPPPPNPSLFQREPISPRQEVDLASTHYTTAVALKPYSHQPHYYPISLLVHGEAWSM